MSFREMLRILRARWYVVAVVLVVTAMLSWPVYHPKAQYQATAVIVLVPPKEPSAPNTLAATTPSVAASGLAVDDILLSSTEAGPLRRAGVTDSFTIAPRNSGTDETPAYTIPSEQLTVTGPDPATALRELTTLVGAFDANLKSMQENVGVGAKSEITTGALAQPSVAQLHGSRTRGLVGMGVLGIGFAIAVPLWLDRWLVRRARKRSGANASATAAASESAGSAGSAVNAPAL